MSRNILYSRVSSFKCGGLLQWHLSSPRLDCNWFDDRNDTVFISGRRLDSGHYCDLIGGTCVNAQLMLIVSTISNHYPRLYCRAPEIHKHRNNLNKKDEDSQGSRRSPQAWIPHIWLRYVDETFEIWRHGKNELNKFENHLNSRHPRINFTKEIEENQQLPFQDVLLFKKEDNSLGHTIYRKKFHTNRLLNPKSHHYPVQLDTVIKIIVTR